MKPFIALLVLLAGGTAAWIAYRTPAQDYEPLVLEVDPEPAGFPERISEAVPAGFEVKAFSVDGPCCKGCCGKLYEALAAVEGVREAAVSFDENYTLAYAVVPVGASTDACVQALTFDKYSAKPTASAPAAAAGEAP